MLSKRAESILDELDNQGSTEASAVADCLRTIAENGDEESTDEYLRICAQEIVGWARYAVNRFKSR